MSMAINIFQRNRDKTAFGRELSPTCWLKIRKKLCIRCVVAAFVAYAAIGSTAAKGDDYWSVMCKDQGYGINFNIQKSKAFIILEVEGGGTIPAAATTKIIKYVNKPNDKHAIFDFGSATKIGVNVSRPDKAIVYRLLTGKTYPVCNANATIKQSQAPKRKGKIAFTSKPSGGRAQVFIIGANGAGRRQVTTSQGDKYGPSLSHDGRKIAFHTRRGGNNDVFIVDVATGKEKKITKHSTADLDPAFSPDGTKIAFVSKRHGRKNLYVMNSNGQGSVTRLTNTSKAIDGQPCWSPNGREIAYVEGWNNDWDIRIINARGGAARRLTSGADPDWSPDGSNVAYRTKDGAICIIRSDGSGNRQLVSGAGEFNTCPSWSPDGRQITFETSRHSQWGDSELYIVDVSSKKQSRFTNNRLDESNPDWGKK
jgi:Tol biopolymer transport system component